MNIIDKVCKSAMEQSQKRVDDWFKSNGVTIENIKKYKLKVNYWNPYFCLVDKEDWTYVKWTSNTRYELYPARWRNAKKLISSLYI